MSSGRRSSDEEDEDGEGEDEGDLGGKELNGIDKENEPDHQHREKIDSVSAEIPEADQSAVQEDGQDEAEEQAHDDDDDSGDSIRPAYQDRRGRLLTLSELETRKFGSPKDSDRE